MIAVLHQLTLPPRTSSPMMRQAAVWMGLELLVAATESAAMTGEAGRTENVFAKLETAQLAPVKMAGRREVAEVRSSGDVGPDT